jgi:RNA polymerase sigma factor (TIGR02999 family)
MGSCNDVSQLSSGQSEQLASNPDRHRLEWAPVAVDPEPTAILLRRFSAGDGGAGSELTRRLGRDLQELAVGHFRRAQGAVLLQPTMLVNEVWLRLIEREGLAFGDRRMFFGFASRVMRNLLVDEARAAVARGARGGRVSLSETTGRETGADDDVALLDLDAALRQLEERDRDAARIVELRFFGGLELREIAETLELSESTVDRRWRFARAWLRTQLTP